MVIPAMIAGAGYQHYLCVGTELQRAPPKKRADSVCNPRTFQPHPPWPSVVLRELRVKHKIGEPPASRFPAHQEVVSDPARGLSSLRKIAVEPLDDENSAPTGR